ncbi:MAG: PDZ domain-containing protein [Myxococcales bacterium]|nr:PDZ domain-containing protein [Myxococcales bacterium]
MSEHRSRRGVAVGTFLLAALLFLAAVLWWNASEDVASADDEGPSRAVATSGPASSTPTAPPAPPATAPEPDEQLLPPGPLPEEPLPTPPPGIPDGQARCALEPPLPAAGGHLVVGDADEIPYDGRLVTVRDGVATLPWIDGDGHGTLAIEGYAPVEVRWAGGGSGVAARCAPDPVRLSASQAWITGHVRNAEGQPEGKVFVEGCGNQARTDEDGGYALSVSPGTCVVNAFRRDGMLFAQAQPAEVHPRAGGELVVDFELPELPRAGLGVQIQTTERGVEVMAVLPGTAAQDAGLEQGDVVVEIAGISTLDIDLREFVELAVGPVGTEVDVVVEGLDGSRERMVLDRRELKGG